MVTFSAALTRVGTVVEMIAARFLEVEVVAVLEVFWKRLVLGQPWK